MKCDECAHNKGVMESGRVYCHGYTVNIPYGFDKVQKVESWHFTDPLADSVECQWYERRKPC